MARRKCYSRTQPLPRSWARRLPFPLSRLIEEHAPAALSFPVSDLKLLFLLSGQIEHVLAEPVAIAAVLRHNGLRQIGQGRILILPDTVDEGSEHGLDRLHPQVSVERQCQFLRILRERGGGSQQILQLR